MHKIEDIKIWHMAIDLSTEIYRIVANFPNDERFGLSSQIKRSAVSIASNIAEGAGRNSDNEFNHFLGVAVGSSYELLTQILIAAKLALIEKNDAEDIYIRLTQIQKMIYGFQRKLTKNKNN